MLPSLDEVPVLTTEGAVQKPVLGCGSTKRDRLRHSLIIVHNGVLRVIGLREKPTIVPQVRIRWMHRHIPGSCARNRRIGLRRISTSSSASLSHCLYIICACMANTLIEVLENRPALIALKLIETCHVRTPSCGLLWRVPVAIANPSFPRALSH